MTAQSPALPPPPPPRVGRLNSADAILREARRVYVEMRQGKIPSSQGAKLMWALSVLTQMHQAVVLEERLDRIEAAIDGKVIDHDRQR